MCCNFIFNAVGTRSIDWIIAKAMSNSTGSKQMLKNASKQSVGRGASLELQLMIWNPK
jgi:hypothetical protein